MHKIFEEIVSLVLPLLKKHVRLNNMLVLWTISDLLIPDFFKSI